MNADSDHRGGFGVTVVVAVLAVALVACSGPPTPVPPGEVDNGPATPVPESPTASPVLTPRPSTVQGAGDTVRIVTKEEPGALGAASTECRSGINNLVCNDLASDPLTWIDGSSFEVVPLSPIESWTQLEPGRWRFKLRDGVTFHNGAPWNAEQAKFWIDFFGAVSTGPYYYDFTYHGEISGQVVDSLTLDVLCVKPCPILPRDTTFTRFQDAGWYSQASLDEIESMTVGLGPYRIVEWRQGEAVELESFEDYKPNSAFASRAPTISRIIQLWQDDPSARAAMVDAGQADWAEIVWDDRIKVPKFRVATNNQAYIYAIDTMHHPELRKVEVREALTLAVDCESLMEKMFRNFLECYGNIASTDTLGITPENSAPYRFDPDRARQLLEEADYDPNNKIILYIQPGQVVKDVEYAQASIEYWRAVGITVELSEVQPRELLEIGASSCAHSGTRDEFLNRPGGTLEDKCRIIGPGAKFYNSMNLLAVTTATESLDFSRQSLLRNRCFSWYSGVCEHELEKMIETAATTEPGPLRRQRMIDIADHVHDHFHFIPNFMNVAVYGMSKDLEWEPYYAPRLRANTMRFKR